MKQNNEWFIKKRGSYLPKLWPAMLIYLAYLAYMVWVLVYVIINHYDFWPAMFLLIPNWVAAGAIVTWIAAHKS